MNFNNSKSKIAKVALITGGSSGIGRGLAIELARRGYRIGILARRKELLAEVCESIRRGGGVCEFAVCHVEQLASVQIAVDKIAESLGPIDILVLNAGQGRSFSALEFDVTRATETYQVNVMGAVHCLAVTLPKMLARKSGQVVGISSVASFRGLPRRAVYSSSKAALNVLLEGLRVELQSQGVCVSILCPGWVNTSRVGNWRNTAFVIEVDEAARTIADAIECKTQRLTFPKPMAVLGFFMRILPDWLFDLLAKRVL